MKNSTAKGFAQGIKFALENPETTKLAVNSAQNAAKAITQGSTGNGLGLLFVSVLAFVVLFSE
jgi:hypothetical protein